MAATMSIYDFFPTVAADEPAEALRSSTNSLVASGSLPILAALFVEEAVEAVTEIAVRLSISQSIARATSPAAHEEPAMRASNPANAHVNPPKTAVALVAVVEASAAPQVEEEEEDYDPYDGLDEEDEWYEEEGDFYDDDIVIERAVLKSHKNERKDVGRSWVPLRATKDNSKRHERPNKRVGHRLVAKLERIRSNKLDNRMAEKHGRPAPVYWQPGERYRGKTQEERDLEEALRRSQRDGHTTRRITAQSLLDLQNRELTPEDYELLLLLDETVEKKKVSKDTFKTFETTVLEAPLPVDCPVCMSPMDTGEKITTLPCSHQYHTTCIEQWLTMSSPNCPLDGLSLLH